MFYWLVFLFVLLPLTQQKPTLQIQQHLYQYGFLNSSNPSPKQLKESIEKFQRLHELNVTGELNDETQLKMYGRRCGRPSNVLVPTFFTEPKWQTSRVTYKIYNWSEPFTKSQIRDTFENAIKFWTQNINLKIVETESDEADILIYFTEQDGQSNVLGYAYFPENGDIFFDRDENWTLQKTLGAERTYFGWVAAHELGHALGLPHTETRSSIMYPFYSTIVSNPAAVDVARLRSLYGNAVLDNTVLCTGTAIDAILDTKEVIFIVGNQYWTYADGVLRNGPFILDSLYTDLPEKIDAAFSVSSSVYFFSDNVFYKFRKNKITRKTISAGFDGLPSNIDAAFHDSAHAVIYFFKGSKYYAFNIKGKSGNRLSVNGKNIEKDWGVPANLEAATVVGNSQVLFIKKFKCYLVDVNTKKLISAEDCSNVYNCK